MGAWEAPDVTSSEEWYEMEADVENRSFTRRWDWDVVHEEVLAVEKMYCLFFALYFGGILEV